jgi:hypothetical protein
MGQLLRLFGRNRFAFSRQAIAAPAFGVGLAFGNEAGREESFDGRVQSARAQPDLAVRQFLDVLHDAVPVTGALP